LAEESLWTAGNKLSISPAGGYSLSPRQMFIASLFDIILIFLLLLIYLLPYPHVMQYIDYNYKLECL